MLSRGLIFFTDIPLTILGMVLFVMTFTMITLWTLYGRSNGFYERASEMPLRKEGEETT